jgi:hypothetical protein
MAVGALELVEAAATASNLYPNDKYRYLFRKRQTVVREVVRALPYLCSSKWPWSSSCFPSGLRPQVNRSRAR